MKIYSVVISTLLAAAIATAGSPKDEQVDAASAFARLKVLAGTWEADSPNGRVQTIYELIAGGSVLLEHLKVPGEGEMLTAYHLDGKQLVLTHYCIAGNQPHMVAQRFDASTGDLDFRFAGASNLGPGAGHMHDVTLRLMSNDRFDARWDFMQDGKPKFSEDLHYTRVK